MNINTIFGTRDALSCGETTIPTYYAPLTPADREQLVVMGYPRRETRKAVGIRENGKLVVYVANGYYYEVPVPSTK